MLREWEGGQNQVKKNNNKTLHSAHSNLQPDEFKMLGIFFFFSSNWNRQRSV